MMNVRTLRRGETEMEKEVMLFFEEGQINSLLGMLIRENVEKDSRIASLERLCNNLTEENRRLMSRIEVIDKIEEAEAV